MLAPLFGEKRAKLAKCPIKFLEITAAGAIGVYSDVEPYHVVVDGESGIKSDNTVEGWTDALLAAVQMDPEARKQMLGAALAKVEAEFTSESQAPRLAATFTAALCHSRTRRNTTSRKPRVAFFCHSPYLGGAENHLLRHALIMQAFAFEPVMVLPNAASGLEEEIPRRARNAGIAVAYLSFVPETEYNSQRTIDEGWIAEIRAWLATEQIALAQSVTLMREVGEACWRSGIAHIASLYQTSSVDVAGVHHCDFVHSDSLLYGNQWAKVLGVPARRILAHVPDDYFRLGRQRGSGERSPSAAPRIGIFGTLQPRKGQLNAIEAIGLLEREYGIRAELRVYGYDHFYPEYVSQCREACARNGIEDRVFFGGFIENTAAVADEIDIVLCASDWESLPMVLLEAMACGQLIVTPQVGGVGEVLSENNGVIVGDNSVPAVAHGLARAIRLGKTDRQKRLALAYRVAHGECSSMAVAHSLLEIYCEALVTAARRRQVGTRAAPPYSGVVAPSGSAGAEAILFETLERVREQLHDTRVAGV